MMQERGDGPEVKGLQALAERLGVDVGGAKRAGVEGNTAGIETPDLLFSRRLDSRTYFVQDRRFGLAKEGGAAFDGPDDELLKVARDILERLETPAAEIAELSVLAEQAQEGRFDPDTGAVALEPVYAGKRTALVTRQVEKLPVWSSSMLLGLNWDRSIGFLQLHWPEIPGEVVARARKLQAIAGRRWTPPERPGAKVESVEAGIIHSPAVGFVMDFAAAIRVIYTPTDESFGKKPVLYVDENGDDVPIPRQFEKFDEPPFKPRPVLPDRDRIHLARGQFRSLLMANPNYFGTLGDLGQAPQLVINQDTYYEQIGCIGYEPALKRLEAVVYVRQETGYGGDICTAGTPEYVRFYLSYDGGATWVDQGMGSFTAHDIPGSKPLEFDVTVHIDPPAAWCFTEVLPIARAILAWNDPPPANTPGHVPVWGEVQDAQIQIAPRRFFVFDDLFAELKVELTPELAKVVPKALSVETAQATTLSIPQLHALYKDTDVPGHRFLHKALEAQALSLAPAAVAKTPFSSLVADLGIDLGAIIGQFLATDGDTSFEELRCVGLNPVESALVGTLTLKRASGYSGDLCSTGSKEYVAFWIDYGSGFTYAGTTSVDVHDLKGIGPNGIEYAVFLPVDLTAHQRPCQAGPVTARVRAILSWQSPPPWWNPGFVPHWGNREETTILINPGPSVDAHVPFLSRLGDIPQQFIGADGKATGSTIQTGFVASDSPFGGVITVAGHVSNAGPGQRYRVMRKLHGAPDSSYLPITNEPAGLALTLSTWDLVNGWQQSTITVHADADGYYPYEDYSSNHNVEGDLLLRWYSTLGEHGSTFDLRIDLSVDGDPAHDVHSNVVTALVDNVDPVATLDIDLGAGVQCADFNTGAVFTGTFDATDEHFGSFSFEIQPSGPAHGVLPVPASGTSTAYGGAIADPGLSGATYTLTTGVPPGPPQPMDPCGYALILHVSDRTNVNSGGGSHRAQAAVGFCIRTG
jgi:hypothetical protein